MTPLKEEEYQRYFFCNENLAEEIHKNRWADELMEAPRWLFNRIHQSSGNCSTEDTLKSMRIFKTNRNTPRRIRVRIAQRYLLIDK